MCLLLLRVDKNATITREAILDAYEFRHQGSLRADELDVFLSFCCNRFLSVKKQQRVYISPFRDWYH